MVICCLVGRGRAYFPRLNDRSPLMPRSSHFPALTPRPGTVGFTGPTLITGTTDGRWQPCFISNSLRNFPDWSNGPASRSSTRATNTAFIRTPCMTGRTSHSLDRTASFTKNLNLSFRRDLSIRSIGPIRDDIGGWMSTFCDTDCMLWRRVRSGRTFVMYDNAGLTWQSQGHQHGPWRHRGQCADTQGGRARARVPATQTKGSRAA